MCFLLIVFIHNNNTIIVGIMTMVPMSMYQAVQGVHTIQTPVGTALQPGLSITPGLPQNIQIAMAPILSNPVDSIVGDQTGETNVTEHEQSGEVTSQQQSTDSTATDTTVLDTTDHLKIESVSGTDSTHLISVPDNTELVIDATEPKHQTLEELAS